MDLLRLQAQLERWLSGGSRLSVPDAAEAQYRLLQASLGSS